MSGYRSKKQDIYLWSSSLADNIDCIKTLNEENYSNWEEWVGASQRCSCIFPLCSKHQTGEAVDFYWKGLNFQSERKRELMVELINETRNLHIVTIEDPIEFLFKNKNSFISQREVGIDTPSFSHALKDALRQDPDIILIGEMRDIETTTIALNAAETGHFILSTMHSNNTYEAVSRIIDIFPQDQQNQVRVQLSNVLVGAISQRLHNHYHRTQDNYHQTGRLCLSDRRGKSKS